MSGGKFFVMPREALEALGEGRISLTAFAVHSALASRCNGVRTTWPRIETIAQDVGRGRTQVKKAISELRAAGLITSDRRGYGKANLYTVPIVPSEETRPVDSKRVGSENRPSQDMGSENRPIVGRKTDHNELEPINDNQADMNAQNRRDSKGQNYIFPEVGEEIEQRSVDRARKPKHDRKLDAQRFIGKGVVRFDVVERILVIPEKKLDELRRQFPGTDLSEQIGKCQRWIGDQIDAHGARKFQSVVLASTLFNWMERHRKETNAKGVDENGKPKLRGTGREGSAAPLRGTPESIERNRRRRR